MGWYQKDEKVTGDNENSRENSAFRHILVVVYHPPYSSIIKGELKKRLPPRERSLAHGNLEKILPEHQS
ncbi:hypothetical protein BK411_23075, partial [Vibrio splendidus]